MEPLAGNEVVGQSPTGRLPIFGERAAVSAVLAMGQPMVLAVDSDQNPKRVEARSVMIDKVEPAFLAYAAASVLLVIDTLFLWAYSGVVRAKVGVAINPEDAARFGVPLSLTDPPEVARVLRAHGNAQATIFPFLLLGLVYVLIGGSAEIAAVLFTIFTAARIAHSVSYLLGKQPWRTVFFIIGGLATIALAAFLVWRIAEVAANG